MNLFNPNNDHHQSEKQQQQKVSLPRRLLSDLNRLCNYPVTIRIPTIPTTSFPSFFAEKKNHAMTNYEIKMCMLDSPVYKIGQNRFPLKSKSSKRGKLELYCVSKADAEDLKRDDFNDEEEVLDTQLAQVVELEGRMPPISLVPELAQVKNAIEIMNKDRKKDMVDLSFSGVPVFQSDCLKGTIPGKEGIYTPLFFRKEDLEENISTFLEPEYRDIIKVSAFEDIIQKMKDNSTEESNNVRFVMPGKIILR